MATSGLWGMGAGMNTKTLLGIMPFLKGFLLTEKWSDIEPSPGVYNFADLNKQYLNAVTLDLDCGFMVWTGSNAPDWLYQAPFSVPKLIINTGAAGQNWGYLNFPYYYDDTYKQRFRMMLTALINNLAAQPPNVLDKVKYIQSAEGTTGDEGPFHGEIIEVTINGIPVNPADYPISESGQDLQWDAFKKAMWAFLDTLLKNNVPTCQMMINPANNAYNWTYAQEKYPEAYLKHGDMSHNFSFQWNTYYTEYMQLRRENPAMFTRGEFDMVDKVAVTWNQSAACPQAVFCMISQALHANMTSLNLTLQTFYYFKTPDFQSYEFFNEFSTPTNNDNAVVRKGFAYLRRQVNIADIDLYSEEAFGTLIDPTMQKRYANLVNIINADPLSNEWNKKTRITNNKISMANSVRKERLALAFEQYGFRFGPIPNRDNDNWNYDFNYDNVEGNFKRYINQINPYATTKPMVRLGDPAVDQLGRYALYTETEMLFETTSEGLTPLGNNHVTISVYYWDGQVGTIRLFYWNGRKKNAIGTIITAGNQQYAVATFLVTDFKGGQRLPSSADFTIKKVSGKNVPISLIKISALSLPPTGDERDEDGEDEEPKEDCEGKEICFNIQDLLLAIKKHHKRKIREQFKI